MDENEPRFPACLVPILIGVLLLGVALGFVASALLNREQEPDLAALKAQRAPPPSVSAARPLIGTPFAPPTSGATSSPQLPTAPSSPSVPTSTKEPTTSVMQPAGSVASASPAPAPSATSQPTTVVQEAQATATPPVGAGIDRSPEALRQRIVAAEMAVRSGQFAAEIDYGGETHTSALVRFDYGDAQRVPRFHLQTTYQSPTGTEAQEFIAIGDRWWQRQPDGAWIQTPPREGVWGQLQSYLPRMSQATSVAIVNTSEAATTLEWQDAALNADKRLVVTTDTGVPREFRQITHGNSTTTMTVIYLVWNTPVEIMEPPSQ